MSKIFLIILFVFSTNTFAEMTFKGMEKKQWDQALKKYQVKKMFPTQECAYVKNRVNYDKEWGYICTNDIIFIMEFPSNATARGTDLTNEYYAKVTEVKVAGYWDGGVQLKVKYSNAKGCSTRVIENARNERREPITVNDQKVQELKISDSRYIAPLPMYFKEDWKTAKAWAERCGGNYPGSNPFYLKYEKDHHEVFIKENRY